MTPSPFAHRRPGAKATVVALVAALAGALWLGSAASSPASGSVQQTASTLTAELSASPPRADGDRAELRKDVQAARKLKGKDKKAALKKIKAAAANGEYGDKVEKRADRRAAAQKAHFALLPDALQADLTQLRAMEPGEDRKKARADIREKSLAGGYGDKVKEAAELMEPYWKK